MGDMGANDFFVSNMAGPKEPWKFCGCPVEDIFLHNSTLGGEPCITMVSVGNTYRFTLTFDEFLLSKEKSEALMEKIVKIF